MSTLTYEDWRDFFADRLTRNGDFVLSESLTRGGQDIEIYTAVKHNPDTYIEVAYFSPVTLFSLKILNPAAPGKNKEQDNEYFYRYQFTPGKDYGGVGLQFNEMNAGGIERLLSEGFTGQETVYYRNGKAVKSVLLSDISYTYYFEEKNFWGKVLGALRRVKVEYDDVKLVRLEEVFGGLR